MGVFARKYSRSTINHFVSLLWEELEMREGAGTLFVHSTIARKFKQLGLLEPEL